MREFLRIILLVINVISCVATLVLGILGILAEILNPRTFEKLLSRLNIPLTFERFIMVAYISLAVCVITYLMREKFFGA